MYNCICAGKVEEFTAPKAENYKLECWGAAGRPAYAVNAGHKYTGYAYGGYSIGKIALNKNDAIYVVVGGAGAENNGTYGGNGGYNGGGRGGNGQSGYSGASGGGGATSITTTNRGELKNFASYRNEVLIVAGGSGGPGVNSNPTGAGGGENGSSVRTYGWSPYGISPVLLQGATQTTGNAFGVGGNASNRTSSSQGMCGVEGQGGGGGGFYGGYAYHGEGDGSDCSGSGGSGYVNKDIIIDGDTQAGVQSPEGYDGCCIVTWFLE